MVSASERAEIYAFSPEGEGAEGISHLLSALATGRFLYEIRGLPITEFDVQIFENIYPVTVDPSQGTISTKIGKCKQLLSNTRITVENVEVNVSDYSVGEERIRLLFCRDLDRVSEAVLRSLFQRDALPLPTVTAVYSHTEGQVRFRYSGRGDRCGRTALAVSLAVSSELSLTEPGKRFVFCPEGGSFFINSQGQMTVSFK